MHPSYCVYCPVLQRGKRNATDASWAMVLVLAMWWGALKILLRALAQTTVPPPL